MIGNYYFDPQTQKVYQPIRMWYGSGQYVCSSFDNKGKQSVDDRNVLLVSVQSAIRLEQCIRVKPKYENPTAK